MYILCIDTPRNAWASALIQTVATKKTVLFFFVLATLGTILIYYRLRGHTTIVLASPRAQYWFTMLARICAYTIVWVGHSLSEQKTYPLLRSQALFAHTILCPNQGIQADYLRIGIAGNKTKLTYPPLPQSMRTEPHRGGITIGCDGIHTLKNGMATFLKAITIAQEILGPLRIRIGGTVLDQKGIIWLAKTLYIEQQLQLIPSTTHEWVQACDIYVLPGTDAVPVPVSISRAQGYGCAIIATDAQQYKEFIQPNKNGIVIEPNNAELLSQAIITLARDTKLRADYAEESKRFADAIYTTNQLTL